MATVDLEKLRMCGAGKAIGVLTSGGDAQGGRGAGPVAGGRGASTCLPATQRAPATVGQDLGSATSLVWRLQARSGP